MGGLSNLEIGAIVIGAIILGSFLVPTGPSSKEVRAEAHKRLVGKLAEDKATAQHHSRKASGPMMVRVALMAVLVGLVSYVVYSNREQTAETPSEQVTTPSP